jgi:YD repeat-containing protein
VNTIKDSHTYRVWRISLFSGFTILALLLSLIIPRTLAANETTTDQFAVLVINNYEDNITGNIERIKQIFPDADIQYLQNDNESTQINRTNCNNTNSSNSTVLESPASPASDGTDILDDTIHYTIPSSYNIDPYKGDALATVKLFQYPGRNGLDLDLNLHYTSNVYNTSNNQNNVSQAQWVGMGWSTGGGTIYKDFGKDAESADDDALYIAALGFDTEKLVGIGNNRYKTRFEDYSEITYVPDTDPTKAYWMIKSTAGLTYKFSSKRYTTLPHVYCNTAHDTTGTCGPNCGSRASISQSHCSLSLTVTPYAWDLTRIEDRYGNYVELNYTTITGASGLHFAGTVESVVMYEMQGMCDWCSDSCTRTNYNTYSVSYTKESYISSIADSSGRKLVFVLGTVNRTDVGAHNKLYTNENLCGPLSWYEPQDYMLSKYLEKILAYDSDGALIEGYKLRYDYLNGSPAQKLVLSSVSKLNLTDQNQQMTTASFRYYPLENPVAKGSIEEMTNLLGGKIYYAYEPKTFEFLNGARVTPDYSGFRIKAVYSDDNTGNIKTTKYSYTNGNFNTENKENSYVGYQKVIISYPDNGYEKLLFYNSVDQADCQECPYLKNMPYPQIMDGTLYRKETYDNNGKKLSINEISWEAAPIVYTGFTSYDKRKVQETSNLQGVPKNITYTYMQNNTVSNNGKPRKIIESAPGQTKITYLTYAYELNPIMQQKMLLDQVAVMLVGSANSNFTQNGISSTNINYARKMNWSNTTLPLLTSEMEWRDTDKDKNIDPDEFMTTKRYTYDPYGNVVSMINTMNLNTSWAYQNGIFQSQENNNLLGMVWSSNYDDAGNLLSNTDANNQITIKTYDEYNRPQRVVRPLDTHNSPSMTFTYALNNPKGNLIHNPSFELGVVEWGSPLNQQDKIVSGSSCISSDSSCARAVKGNWGFGQKLTLEPNTQYTLSYWTKLYNYPNGTRVAICADNESWCGQKYVSCGAIPTSTWKQVSCSFTTGANTNNNPSMVIMIGSDGYNNSQYNFVDDLRLVKATETAPSVIIRKKLQDSPLTYIEARTVYDGFGKDIRKEYEDGSDDIVLLTYYDSMNRKTAESTPTGEFTRYTYESSPLVRQVQIVKPGMTIPSRMSYGSWNGTSTINSYDELGIQTRRYYDAYGNLIRVDIN